MPDEGSACVVGYWKLAFCLTIHQLLGQENCRNTQVKRVICVGWKRASLTREQKLDEVSFPLGGIGTGCIGLAGNGGCLQDPYVLKIDNRCHMFHGCWSAISLAVSKDGITFTRKPCANGKSYILDHQRGSIPRDPMVIQVGNLWFCYYIAQPNGKNCVYCLT